MTENVVVELNQIVGCRLLSFLNGTDATNFIEAVNDSKQFLSIAKTLDHHFIEIIKAFCSHQRIILPRWLFEPFADDEYDIDEEQLILVSRRYSCVIEPFPRLYIHPCFSIAGFSKLCEVYRTSLFKCYSRFLPFNTVWYNADFGLLNYEPYAHTIGSTRMLNDHENKLLRVNTYFHTKKNRDFRSNLEFVQTTDEFKHNLATRFSSGTWLEAIDFSKFAIVGGCVVNALCRSPFPDTKKQDVNLFFYGDKISDFETTVAATVDTLNKMTLTDVKNAITAEKIPGIPCYNVLLPCNVQLKFSWSSVGNSKHPLSHMLHNLDLDISQVAFTGDKIVATFPFLEAIATKTVILYTLHARIAKHVCTRIAKYCSRGFDLLQPINFDGDFDSLMAQAETPLYRVEHHQYIDDDSEVRLVTKEFCHSYMHNVDTYRLQEQFIHMVYPQLLEYK